MCPIPNPRPSPHPPCPPKNLSTLWAFEGLLRHPNIHCELLLPSRTAFIPMGHRRLLHKSSCCDVVVYPPTHTDVRLGFPNLTTRLSWAILPGLRVYLFSCLQPTLLPLEVPCRDMPSWTMNIMIAGKSNPEGPV